MKNYISALPSELLNKFLASNVKLSLYASGGCSSILGWITLPPGSSKNISETRNPYTKAALEELLGYSPSKSVDLSVSRDLAFKAFTNTQKYMYIENENSLHFNPERILGVGVTGALRSNYARRGDHHLYLSLLDQKKYVTYHIELDKNKRSREEEDYFVSYNALNIINNTSHNEKSGRPSLVGELQENDSISIVEEKDTIDFLLPTLENQTKNIIFMPDGKILVDQVIHKCIVIPGSFNPIHHGHVSLGETVAEKFGVDKKNIIFELSAKNADKGLISREELDRRVRMIVVDKGFAAMLTQRPLFYSKNEYLRDGHFVVGADTYKRIVDAKYYDESKEVMISKLREFEKFKNCLVVAPRLNTKTNELEGLKNFDVPDVLSAWIRELKDFRVDISSTEIRKKMQEKEERAKKM